ncbi:CopG family transcriptional regulator [Candidatus Woesearchaeota archaeon]|nr:CopG family transcriptional regulator [Candidatus Woesearchaeota archaeon]
MSSYTNVALPAELAKKIDEIVKDANLGYKTKAEFVKEAVRLSIREISKYKH